MMRLLRLAAQHATRRRAMSLTAMLTSLIMAAAIVALTGDATARGNDLLQSLRDPEARSIVIRTSGPDVRLSRGVAEAIARLPGVDRAVALFDVSSVTSPALHDPGTSAAMASVDVLRGSDPFRLVRGRLPTGTEVIVPEHTVEILRMVEPLASVITGDRHAFAVVGVFAVEPLGAIDDTLSNTAVSVSTETEGYSVLAMLAREPADVATVLTAVRLLLPRGDTITVDYEARAAELERSIAAAGRDNLAALAIAIVLVGACIQLAQVVLASLLQRREHARRRALGFPRIEIVAITVIEAMLLSAIGTGFGTSLAIWRLAAAGAPIGVAQCAATIGLLALTSLLASLPGAFAAGWQDPARLLRIA